MAKYEMITGPFEGAIVEEGYRFLDVDFRDLDDDMQFRIREWAEDQVLYGEYVSVQDGEEFAYPGGSDRPISMNQIKEDYENSWESREIEEDLAA